MLELVEVAKSYPGPPEVRALSEATMAVRAGEIVAIFGPSGSGKSTLLNIIGLLDEPTAGIRRLDGTDTATLRERERTALRATRVGFVFQAFHLIPYLDCVDNVVLPLVHQGWPTGRARAKALEALEHVGLGHRVNAKPVTLSGGEQQRVAIARAIVHQPALLLCDEPTGNLDQANTQAVLGLLRRMVTADRAVVIVTHESDVRDAADRAIEVVDGVVRT